MNSNANARYLLRNAKDDNMLTGKYVQRDNQFKSKQFTFDLDLCEAHSYGWWLFVIKVGSTIYFNNFHCSMQTGVHQEMARNILMWEGVGSRYAYREPKQTPLFKSIQIKYVYYKEGLNHLELAVKNMRFEISQIEAAIKNPKSRKATNKIRAAHILSLKKEIKATQKLDKILTRQFKINDKIKSAKEDALYLKEEKRIEAKHLKTKTAMFLRRKRTLESYLETNACFRDYEIARRELFGDSEAKVSRKVAVHQLVDMHSLEHDVDNALYNFNRDGFGHVVFYT